MYCVWPPYILRPTTRLAYCTVIFRTPCVIVITAAMTMIRNNTNNTKTIGFTWLEPVFAEPHQKKCAGRQGNHRHDSKCPAKVFDQRNSEVPDYVSDPRQHRMIRFGMLK